jgi:hypothetical protein
MRTQRGTSGRGELGSDTGVDATSICEVVPIGENRGEGSHLAGDDAFIFAWGRSNEALRSRARQLAVSMLLNVVLVAGVMFLAWRNERKETYVFVRNAFGEVIQADATSFLHAGDTRTSGEVKSFLRRWVVDAFTWTPLDVTDRVQAALRVVDPSAQAAVKGGMRLGERQQLVERGASGRVYDDPGSDKAPQAVIVRNDPLEVLVTFDRYLVEPSGEKVPQTPLIVRASLKRVPRGPGNWGYGLVLVGAQISEKL